MDTGGIESLLPRVCSQLVRCTSGWKCHICTPLCKELPHNSRLNHRAENCICTDWNVRAHLSQSAMSQSRSPISCQGKPAAVTSLIGSQPEKWGSFLLFLLHLPCDQLLSAELWLFRPAGFNLQCMGWESKWHTSLMRRWTMCLHEF